MDGQTSEGSSGAKRSDWVLREIITASRNLLQGPMRFQATDGGRPGAYSPGWLDGWMVGWLDDGLCRTRLS